MAEITFRSDFDTDFNEPKAIETILYISQKITKSDKYKICKMIYLADKLSLYKYGRLLFGETYSAMEQGVTPSNSYDLLKRFEAITNDVISVKGNNVTPLRAANLDHLSESDIECLDQTISSYDRVPKKLRDDARDKAWKKAWETTEEKKSVNVSLECICNTLDDSEELYAYLTNQGVD